MELRSSCCWGQKIRDSTCFELPVLVLRVDGFFTDECSAFLQTISQQSMQLRSPNLAHKCSTMSPGNPSILASKDKVTTSVLVFRQHAILPLLLRIRKLRWIFPTVIPHHTQAVLATPEFSRRHFPASACRWVFPDVGFALSWVPVSSGLSSFLVWNYAKDRLLRHN